MKDNTLATRLERGIATLEFLLGRLERVSALLEENLPPAASSAPPLSPEAVALAEKVVNRQLEEQREAMESTNG